MKDQNKKSNFTAKEAVKNPVETSAKAPTRAGHPMTVALGSNLKRIREQSGMTQQTLAFKSEMDRTFISLVERGATNPSLYSLGTICWVLKISLGELFAGVTDTLPPSSETGGKKRRSNQASHEPRPPSSATLKRAETMRLKKLSLQAATMTGNAKGSQP